MTPDTLAAAGELLAGAEWQTALARMLGPLHPQGARESLDVSLVRKWVRQERAIPGWVQPALAKLLAEQPAKLAKQARKCEALAKRLAPC
jgi:hypothetical protein